MFDIGGPIGSFLNFLVIALGFGAIIFIHELGHFLAAKWAGIRVQAFSIGFGHVLCSYRKGMGFRLGSSEPAYRAKQAHPNELVEGVSPTEYRLSALPLGGYVKMLGQEDANPGAVSDAPDSYQNCSVPKRMVVISAGVVMNLISAAVLFVIVFGVGMRIMPPTVGRVVDGSPAASAEPIEAGVGVGLARGDRVVSIGDHGVRAFRDIATESAMSRRSSGTVVRVEREGYATPIGFRVDLEPGLATGLLELGVLPTMSGETVYTDQEALWAQQSARAGLGGVPSGATLVSIDGAEVETATDLYNAAERSGGAPMTLGYVSRDGEEGSVVVEPEAALMRERVRVADRAMTIEHVLGLTGAMMVHPEVTEAETKQGLKPGDVFARIDGVVYPSLEDGIALIRAKTGERLAIEVLRGGEVVALEVEVDAQGRVGFYPHVTTDSSARVGTWSGAPGGSGPIEPGSVIETVNGVGVSDMDDVARAIVETADGAGEAVEVVFGTRGADGAAREVVWSIEPARVGALRELGYRWPGGERLDLLLLPVERIDKAANPLDAIDRGLHESRRVMLQTYLTFLRLFQGTVKVEHLKGPVGIAHLGTIIADEGFIKVLFFLALISINLAVINFLPLPIVDGGQFLMLCYEWVRGRPVPVGFQNAVTMMGLVLIGSMFLLVTFNDIRALLGL
jgi:regulator of sigma E protease